MAYRYYFYGDCSFEAMFYFCYCGFCRLVREAKIESKVAFCREGLRVSFLWHLGRTAGGFLFFRVDCESGSLPFLNF